VLLKEKSTQLLPNTMQYQLDLLQ